MKRSNVNCGTMDTSVKRKNEWKYTVNISFWLRLYSFLGIITVLCWWVIPIFVWGVQYIRWYQADVASYEIYLFRSELVRDTNYIEPFRYQLYDEDGLLRVDYPAYVFKSEYDAVSSLFSIAWNVTWNPFDRCNVSYDEVFGFPDYISCGQWQEIQTTGFEPNNN